MGSLTVNAFFCAPAPRTYRPLSVNRRRNASLTRLGVPELRASLLSLPLERDPFEIKRGSSAELKALQAPGAESVSTPSKSVSSLPKSVSTEPLKAFQTDPVPGGRGERAVFLWLARRQLANGGAGDTGIATRKLMALELDMPKATVRTCLYRLLKAGRIEFVRAIWGRRAEAGTAFRLPALALSAAQQFLKAFQQSVSTVPSSSSSSLCNKESTTRERADKPHAELLREFSEGIRERGLKHFRTPSKFTTAYNRRDPGNPAVRLCAGVTAPQLLDAVQTMEAYVGAGLAGKVRNIEAWIFNLLNTQGPLAAADMPKAIAAKRAPKSVTDAPAEEEPIDHAYNERYAHHLGITGDRLKAGERARRDMTAPVQTPLVNAIM